MFNVIEMSEQLKGDYREVFEKAELYSSFHGGNMDKDVYEDKMMNLFDLLTEAQHEGKPVEKIIGPDIEMFCEEYFAEERENKRWRSLPDRLYHVMWVVFVLGFLDVFVFQDTTDIFAMKSNMTPFIFSFCVGFVLDAVLGAIMRPMIFKKKIKPMVYYSIVIIVWFAVIIGGIICLSDYEIKIPVLPMVIVSGVYAIIYFAITTISRYKKYGRIAKVDKAEKQAKKEFNQSLTDKSFEEGSIQGMASRFRRINKRRRKRGKPELTQEDFAAKIRKEERINAKLDKWMILVFVALVLGPTIPEMINNTIVDGLILGAMLCVVEFFIYRSFKKISVNGSRIRLRILEECENQGITIEEYEQKMKENKED